MTSRPLTVLYEDNHLLAVNKPAALPTMGVAEHLPSLIVEARAYIKDRYQKPGNVYLGTVSRLDAPVTGVVLFARTSKAAARLSEQYRTREVEKTYWAIVEGRLEPPSGTLTHWLAEDERHRRMHAVAADQLGARECRLHYRHLATLDVGTLVEIELETGRKHQIRVQFAARGTPILGDRKYGSKRPFPEGIALHARRLVVRHPVRDEQIEITAPLPAAWKKLGIKE